MGRQRKKAKLLCVARKAEIVKMAAMDACTISHDKMFLASHYINED